MKKFLDTWMYVVTLLIFIIVIGLLAWHTHDARSIESSSYQHVSSSKISRDHAERIVTDKYGGDVINVEADHRHGVAVWEVEVKESREGRIEVDVDRSTGAILDMERD